MKKTQMIHSPRTFKLGLGLVLAAGLMSMPVLTGANEGDDARANSKTERRANKPLTTGGKATKKKASVETKRRLASAKKPATQGRKSNAENRALERARLSKELESKAKKVASKLTPEQRAKLLSFLDGR